MSVRVRYDRAAGRMWLSFDGADWLYISTNDAISMAEQIASHMGLPGRSIFQLAARDRQIVQSDTDEQVSLQPLPDIDHELNIPMSVQQTASIGLSKDGWVTVDLGVLSRFGASHIGRQGDWRQVRVTYSTDSLRGIRDKIDSFLRQYDRRWMSLDGKVQEVRRIDIVSD